MGLELCGHGDKINSEFPVVAIRRETPNSHDQFRMAGQADKATVQLAANSGDPTIRGLVLELLAELQDEVDEAHESDAGVKMSQRAEERREARAVAARELDEREPGEAEESRQPSAPEKHVVDVEMRRADSLSSSDGEEHAAQPGDKSWEDADYKPDDDDEDSDSGSGNDDDTEEEDGDDDDGHVQYGGRATNNKFLEGEKEVERNEMENMDVFGPHDLLDFVDNDHPDDAERHTMALLELPPHHLWYPEDLDNENYLRIGLLLLYNKIHGRTGLALTHSIHINYDELNLADAHKMTRGLAITASQAKATKEHSGVSG